MDRIQSDENNKIAIVVQGPIIIKNDFTFETLKLYINIFPNAIVILSTWDDQSVRVISKIRDLGIRVIINKYPKYSGIGNVNYQIISTINGLVKAESLGTPEDLLQYIDTI